MYLTKKKYNFPIFFCVYQKKYVPLCPNKSKIDYYYDAH